jgi:alpha-D-ribose 1-methylphosphonate 5-triphosphate synthase subunit PhnH
MNALAFADPTFESQAAFRRIMRALSAPGTILACGQALAPPAPLARAAAAALLTLADFETPLWIAPSFPAAVGDYLAFHSGAPRAAAPDKAAFALVDLSADGLDLARFAFGTAEYPDRSTTIVAQAASLDAGPRLRLAGPGIKGEATLALSPLPVDFVAQWAANRAGFPLGVDLIFVADDRLAALPRSTAIIEGAR